MKRTTATPPRQTLLTPDDVAQTLGVKRDYVLKILVYQRRLAFVKVGGHVRFTPEAVDKLIAANTTEAVP
jgi:excisionase family DNA binding protein